MAAAVAALVVTAGHASTPRVPVKAPTRVAAAVAALPPGDAAAGQAKAESERCFECHGANGQGQGRSNGPEGKFAKLAGQSADYLVKQMGDFRAGTRKNDEMLLIARVVDDADLRDIAAYFAAQAPMRGDGGGAGEVARRLVTHGDAARGVPACASCHGSADQPPASALHPRLAGQEYRYLAQQLADWRQRQRRNSPGDVMNRVAAALSDAEIDALALYLSGLSPRSGAPQAE